MHRAGMAGPRQRLRHRHLYVKKPFSRVWRLRLAPTALATTAALQDCFITGLPGVHDDHDLARTAGEVNAFVFTLEKFVIHVYVLCSHGQMVPWKTFVLMCPATFKVCSRSVFHVLYLFVLPFASSHGAPILLYGRRSSLVKHPISI